MPVLFVLIGLPGSGKTTWRNRYVEENTLSPVVISQDDLIEEHAAENEMTYSEAFADARDAKLLKGFEQTVKERFREALARGEDIVLDRTNMSKKSRRSFLSQVPDTYQRIAVVFEVPDEILRSRLLARAEATGKHIPEHVIESMSASYEAPTTDDGEFHQVHIVKGN